MIVSKQRLDILRASSGKKLSELGVSDSVIKRINAGKEIQPYTVGKLATSLNCEVRDLLPDPFDMGGGGFI